MSTRPRLRPLEIFPAQVKGETLFCLRDPAGLASGTAFLPRAAALLAAMCDGTRTIDEVVAEFQSRTGVEVLAEQVANLVEQLDQGMFLDSPRFAAHIAAVHGAFHDAAVRAPAHAGVGYPNDPIELARFLDRHGMGTVSGEPVTTLIAPHIDFHRGGALYTQAYRALGAEPPELVVIFGTDHKGASHPFTLTRKHYGTPFGDLETDVGLVDHLAQVAGGDALFADELHHRHEHSIEFQAVWLRHIFGDRTPPALPVLCGSLHRHVVAGSSPRTDPRVADFLGALAKAVAGKRVLLVAGADFAHVGPRFGDGPMGSAENRSLVEDADRASLAAAARGDAEGFFTAVAAVEDRYRVCGLAPIYHALALHRAAAPGRLLAYDQCAADEQNESFVSIAAMTL